MTLIRQRQTPSYRSCINTRNDSIGRVQTRIRVRQTPLHIHTHSQRTSPYVTLTQRPDPAEPPASPSPLSISTLHEKGAEAPSPSPSSSTYTMAISFAAHMFIDNPAHHARGRAIIAHMPDIHGPLIPGRLGHVFVQPAWPIDHTLPVNTEIEMILVFAIAWFGHRTLPFNGWRSYE